MKLVHSVKKMPSEVNKMYKQSKHMVFVTFFGASFIRVLKNDIMQTELMHTLRTAVSKQHIIIGLNLFLDKYGNTRLKAPSRVLLPTVDPAHLTKSQSIYHRHFTFI